MVRRLALVLVLLHLTLISGCVFGSSDPKPKDAKPTFPVTGVVHIDGKPKQGVHLFLTAAEEGSMNPTTPTSSTVAAITSDDGKFSFSTYLPGDGLPAGNYVISFYWTDGFVQDFIVIDDQKPVKLGASATKFNQKYGTPAKSKFKFTVDKEPVDLKILELTTK